MGTIETRFLFALAAMVSAILHASFYVGLDFGAPAPMEEIRIEVREIVHVAKNEAKQESPAELDERYGVQEQAKGVVSPPDDHRSALKEGAQNRYRGQRQTQVSWRQKMRQKEARHEAAMAEKAEKVAVLRAEKALSTEPFSGANERLYRCGSPRHRLLSARKERDVSRYVGVFPTGLFPSKYVEQMRELIDVSGRGRWSFALPQGSLPIVLDAPKGVLLAAGQDDRRCVVDVDITPRTFFPLRFLQIPLRIVDENDRVHTTVVDVALFENGTFRLTRVAGDPLPFIEGALYDHETVGRNLRRHYLGARLLRDMAGVMFGETP